MEAFVDPLAAVLVFTRVAPISVMLWALGRALVPASVAASLALAVTAALLPLAGPAPVVGAEQLLLVCLREACIGGTFAIALALALSSGRWALAFGLGGRDAPVGQALALVYALAAVSLTLSLGGHRAVIIALAESFHDAPLASGGADLGAFALGVAQLVTDALAAAFGIALPLILAVALLDLVGALAERLVAPRGAVLAGLLRPLALVVLCMSLLVPIASDVPKLVRRSIVEARALTRGLAK